MILLNYASDWFVEDCTLDKIKESLPIINKFYEKDGDSTQDKYPIFDIIKEELPEIYSIPLFSKKFCELLLRQAVELKFIPNEEEDELRQMPEVILHERMPEIYLALKEVIKSVFNPILCALWHRVVVDSHVQIANYNPRDKRQGAWHHDRSSGITVVVPLNTGDYKGGGTEFMWRGTVEPLPTGNALIFPSLTHMHRGLPVTEGNRYLLVFWLGVSHE